MSGRDELAAVARNAIMDHVGGSPTDFGILDADPVLSDAEYETLGNLVAEAALTHLQSDAVIERMARGIHEHWRRSLPGDDWDAMKNDHRAVWRDKARAAVAVLGRGHG
ncbi:MAG: hypothetical protein KF889_25610 [Alphaproteobacteria bacterium]|nr:hypothetical protein [Alphaproteobacteria bacterium]MCW5739627.1 hypothetical protein [Alphaproteobacteria bacterium]